MKHMSNPFFSIIIPAHNAEGHIRKGLDSIREQVCTDYELIVVCDSCADGTADIAREYGARVFEVSYHLDGLTRNKGLDEAKGDWILFMDDDDWFLHEYVFQQLREVCGKHDEDAVLFSFIVRHGEPGYRRQTPDNMEICVWTACWRREFTRDIRFSFRHYWSDVDFHNKACKKPHRFVYWDMPMYYYNAGREGNITSNYDNGVIKRFANRPSHIITQDPYA